MNKYEIRGFHDKCDLEIDFKKMQKVNLLYGGNGSGKSDLLRIINFIEGGQLKSLLYINFDEITITGKNGRSYSINYYELAHNIIAAKLDRKSNINKKINEMLRLQFKGCKQIIIKTLRNEPDLEYSIMCEIQKFNLKEKLNESDFYISNKDSKSHYGMAGEDGVEYLAEAACMYAGVPLNILSLVTLNSLKKNREYKQSSIKQVKKIISTISEAFLSFEDKKKDESKNSILYYNPNNIKDLFNTGLNCVNSWINDHYFESNEEKKKVTYTLSESELFKSYIELGYSKNKHLWETVFIDHKDYFRYSILPLLEDFSLNRVIDIGFSSLDFDEFYYILTQEKLDVYMEKYLMKLISYLGIKSEIEGYKNPKIINFENLFKKYFTEYRLEIYVCKMLIFDQRNNIVNFKELSNGQKRLFTMIFLMVDSDSKFLLLDSLDSEISTLIQSELISDFKSYSMCQVLLFATHSPYLVEQEEGLKNMILLEELIVKYDENL